MLAVTTLSKNQRIFETTIGSARVNTIAERRSLWKTNPSMPGARKRFPVRDYDLAATLTSGQTFRWQRRDDSWLGVIGHYSVRLRTEKHSIIAETAERVSDWVWLADYLQINLDVQQVVRTFPDDEPMRAAITACRGLRLLRQDPWECLASFILSSTKQIVQIQQIIGL